MPKWMDISHKQRDEYIAGLPERHPSKMCAIGDGYPHTTFVVRRRSGPEALIWPHTQGMIHVMPRYMGSGLTRCVQRGPNWSLRRWHRPRSQHEVR